MPGLVIQKGSPEFIRLTLVPCKVRCAWFIDPQQVWSTGNDPSAGSPTDTLLRLLLPLLQIIYTSSRRAASRPKPAYGTNPKRSLTGAIGSSDGRCVQRAGTQSTRADDSRLLGIPRSWEIIASPNPYHEWGSTGFPALSGKARRTLIHSM